MHVADLGFTMNTGVLLGAYYNVNSDTLIDIGKIEFSPDNATTWIDLHNPGIYASNIMWTGTGIVPVLSGNSNGWKTFEVIHYNFASLFGINYGDTVLWRFTFMSDGIQTNKDGLMFDSLYMWDVPPVGIENYMNTDSDVKTYPVPSQGTISIQFENKNSSSHILKIYNAIGELMMEYLVADTENNISLDIESYSDGIYFFSLINSGDGTIDSGKFTKSK